MTRFTIIKKPLIHISVAKKSPFFQTESAEEASRDKTLQREVAGRRLRWKIETEAVADRKKKMQKYADPVQLAQHYSVH